MGFFNNNNKYSTTQNGEEQSYYQKSNELNGESDMTQFAKNILMNSLLKDEEEREGLLNRAFGKIKNNLYNGISSSQNTLKGLTIKMKEVQEAAENWKNFSILFFLGSFLLLISLTFLPFFALAPAKFASLFTLGSVFILLSVAVMKGTQEFIKVLLQKDKIFYSASYIFTVFGTLYYSILKKSYFYVSIFSIAQIISLSFLIASSFPGGINGMKFVTRKIFGLLKSFCCIFINQRESSYLPI